LILRDVGSRNGTALNGQRIIAAPLQDGAIISLGKTEVELSLGAEKTPIPRSDATRFGSLVGTSLAMREAFHLLERAAARDVTVLLHGETGTGKELAAGAIHELGARKEGPFVVVDCGAIPRELLESQLFGHEKGAFTGAVKARPGAFALADGGTLFLDEIGELDLDLQPKLLRALEQQTVQPIGADTPRQVDVRVIAATHRDLRREVNKQTFRPDLYFRLAIFEVALPPLRDRLDDLPLLVETLLPSLTADAAAAAKLKSPAFLSGLTKHAWPGNVRELRNHLERCLTLETEAPGEQARSGPLVVDITQPLRGERDRWVRILEKRYLEQLLAANGDNVSAAARAAGVDRVHLHRLLARHGLR
jgi:DNA-binding NtrC family response regulator